MVCIGFHASHEQIPPSGLLKAVQGAERAGFDGAMCSDHLAPWSRQQGESGVALSWIATALALTDFSIGMVNAPGQRYYPAVIAQAFATIEEMFPGRFWARWAAARRSTSTRADRGRWFAAALLP